MAYLLSHCHQNKFMKTKNQDKEVYHVTPNAESEQWIVSRENSDYKIVKL